jgi:hypothetical protein
MDTMQAFARCAANRGKEHRVFDWDKAAKIIKERKPVNAAAGLSEDWGYTGGDIYRDGEPVKEDDTYVYLSSDWATPVLEIDGEQIECWVMESKANGWNEKTYWPKSALAILKSE